MASCFLKAMAKSPRFALPNHAAKQRYDKALEFLKSQTPSGVHLALEQIGPMASGDGSGASRRPLVSNGYPFGLHEHSRQEVKLTN